MKTAEGERPKVGVGVMLLDSAGLVLLGKRRGAHGVSTYGWCGGHVEFGETLEEAARREVLEETGIAAGELKFLCVSNLLGYGKHYVDVEFVCTDFDGSPRITEPDRVENWDWYRFDALPSPLFGAVDLAIQSHRAGRVYNA
ncbi:MAG: 8-oxo-dGTP diphosphatase [Solirubrobacteraceae bacterium]|jgi:8-oxo-dGTP diphosphatase|nr:8-oxo-dGTP diphosphatase [Solirubrobacteraceae bacterium]